MKNNFLFLALNLSLSLLRTNTASTVPFPDIKPYCILSTISTPHAHAHPKPSHTVQKHDPTTLFPYKSLD